MGMTIRFNPSQLEANILQIGDRAMKGMTARARVMVLKMRDLARSYAPEKTGTLERAIDMQEVRNGSGGRTSFILFVNIDIARPEGDGVVGDYAWIMEEQLHPYGRTAGARVYNLGPISRDKAAGGNKVGGRFLARAIKDGSGDLFGSLVDEVRKVTGGGRSMAMEYTRDTGDDEE
jgi:hypothetical protein